MEWTIAKKIIAIVIIILIVNFALMRKYLGPWYEVNPTGKRFMKLYEWNGGFGIDIVMFQPVVETRPKTWLVEKGAKRVYISTLYPIFGYVPDQKTGSVEIVDNQLRKYTTYSRDKYTTFYRGTLINNRVS